MYIYNISIHIYTYIHTYIDTPSPLPRALRRPMKLCCSAAVNCATIPASTWIQTQASSRSGQHMLG